MSATELLDRRLRRTALAALVFALAGVAAVWWSTRPPESAAPPPLDPCVFADGDPGDAHEVAPPGAARAELAAAARKCRRPSTLS